MRFVIWLILITLIVWTLRRFLRGLDRTTSAPPLPEVQTVRCLECGAHLPRQNAIIEANGQPFCCQDHRHRYHERT